MTAPRLRHTRNEVAILASSEHLADEMVTADDPQRAIKISALATDWLLLHDKLKEAERALEPFADVSGEGDEDFPDDTKVVVKFGRTTHYALTLADFRRAQKTWSDIS